MSEFACPASARLDRSLDVPLSVFERARIVVQLGTAMLAAGLLAVGFIQQRFGPVEMRNVADLIFALAACIVAMPILCIAVRGLFTADPNSFSVQLIALATLAAMATGDFITATLIPVIMSLGHLLEERSILGAQAAIEGLRKLDARNATVSTPEGEREVEPQMVKPGDLLVVRPGDVIAADGEIVEGVSAIDQSSITGESAPEDVGPKCAVYAGTMNIAGLLRVRVTRAGSQTTLGRVVELLRDAEQSKTPVMKLIEQYAGYYVPIILTIAGVVLFVSRDLSRAVAVLVVGCPGALVLAGPTAMVAALAAGSRLGVLIKNTRFLESLADVDTVVLDKTGTVTIGRLELVALQPMGRLDKEGLLRESLSCAVGSRHPVARAITQATEDKGIRALGPTGQIEEISGKGIIFTSESRVALLGRREWLVEEGFSVPQSPTHAGPIVWLGCRDGSVSNGASRVLGCLLLADRPRPEAKEALDSLRELGLRRSVLLTGDRKEVAQQVGGELEMDQVVAEVLPEQKLDAVRAERAAGNSVMVVGDGVNDALALASGDVGVALGAAASDIALRSADVALLANDLGRLPLSVRLARRTRSVIHQNILIGASVPIVFLWLASVGTIEPVVGAVLHNVGAALVIVNSARLLGFGQK